MNVPFFRPWFPEDLVEDVTRDTREVLASGRFLPGKFNEGLENSFKTLCERSEAVAVNSCTTALTICLQHFLKGKEGGEVLVASASFLTSISSVTFAGGTPVLVDCNPETLSFDLDDLEARITPRTRGIVWVHLTGLISPEYERLMQIADKHNLFVIEDCAHALGAEIDGKAAGSIGHAACFSFYPTKVITCGSGGLLTTDDKELADYARQMRLFGKSGTEITELGKDWFLDELRAAMALRQMERLETNMALRQEKAALYNELLAATDGVTYIQPTPTHKPSYYHVCAFTSPEEADRIIKGLKDAHGVESKIIYRPCHHEVVFKHLDTGGLDKTVTALNGSVCLPFFPDITEEQIRYVMDSLGKEVAKQ